MRVIIKRNDYDEFEVPTAPAGAEAQEFADGIYYADDRDDAIDTARFTFGADVDIVVRRGTYSGDGS